MLKAPIAAPVLTYDWSGIYIGAARWVVKWDSTDVNFYNAPGSHWSTGNNSRLIYGGFTRIQKQWGNFVLGIEGGWNGLDNGWNSTAGGGIPGASCAFAAGFSCQSRINDIGYIGGRVRSCSGTASWCMRQGGYAQADIDTRVLDTATGTTFDHTGATHGGWYAGVGGEYAVLDNVIIGVDYKHYEFDTRAAQL